MCFSSLSNVAYNLSRMYARQAHTNFAPVVAHPFAAIIMSATFVESYFNELIETSSSARQISPARADELRGDRIEDKLTKFLADISNSQTKWNRGEQPYQSFRELMTLRNELVPYKPEFIPMGSFPNRAVEQIANRFPHEWLGRCDWTVAVLTPAVADWAWQTARNLVEEFHRLRNTKSPWAANLPGWRDEDWPDLP
jgi:hypothetical protein